MFEFTSERILKLCFTDVASCLTAAWGRGQCVATGSHSLGMALISEPVEKHLQGWNSLISALNELHAFA